MLGQGLICCQLPKLVPWEMTRWVLVKKRNSVALFSGNP